ncbi:MAG: acyl-CoA thioester hydrolase/BAAT C-terminal domain-containing protein [Pyrinomonadaceae bacterium]
MEYLKSRKEINPKQIGLIGHSEGGMIAPLVAVRSKDVAFIVLMAGTGQTGEDVLYTQSALIQKAGGASTGSDESKHRRVKKYFCGNESRARQQTCRGSESVKYLKSK